MVVLVSFATPNFYLSQRKLGQSAIKYGVDKVIRLNHLWLKRQRNFFKTNIDLFSKNRGYGNYVWKPYIISRILQKVSPDDFIIYSDSGIEFVNNILPLLRLCEANKGLLLFQTHERLNKEWTKRDCFFYTNCDANAYYEAVQAIGGFIVIKKNDFTVSIINEWLDFCQDPRIISDDPNVCGLPNLPGFVAHRHDQSVLSVLASKHNIHLFRDPSQWGNAFKTPSLRVEREFLFSRHYEGKYAPLACEDSPYSTILNIHRRKATISRMSFSYIKYIIDGLIGVAGLY